MVAPLSPTVSVSPQIAPEDCSSLAAQGFTTIINNRPDDEAPGQPSGAMIEAAARASGMGYVAIPIDHNGFGPDQVVAMVDAIAAAPGPVLAYCRSGTRSTHLWALAEASCGTDPMSLIEAAAAAGYDIAMMAGTLKHLASR
ncbi:MAG: TIGR01244 family sulfur transferase [Polymorphobacter sp.]|uniref:TIGR01244 family sulfur transferase n=1 Tax=Polymorphobacter sp. TaxID=1909290 RepID=UPI003A86CDC4